MQHEPGKAPDTADPEWCSVILPAEQASHQCWFYISFYVKGVLLYAIHRVQGQKKSYILVKLLVSDISQLHPVKLS